MNVDLMYPVVWGIGLFALATLTGVSVVKRVIHVYEAKHELKHGSAGFYRSLSGWSMIVLWVACVWFCASILGDWGQSGDLPGAIDRGWLRLQILIEIVIAAMNND